MNKQKLRDSLHYRVRVRGELEIVRSASRFASLAPTARAITMCACAISRFC
jgi:hypothetical protein